MKYFVGIDGRSMEVEIVELEGRGVALVEGREVPFDLGRIEGTSHYSLILDLESHRFTARPGKGGCAVQLDGSSYQVTVETEHERLLRRTRRAAGRGAGPGKLMSDMAGIVVRILVEQGATVSVGDPVLILEAMKMENEIRSPAAGTVDRIHVQERSTVLVGDELITFR